MEITLVQGLLLALAAGLIGIDYQLEGLFIFRPIIVAPIAGLILGDLNTGLLVGGITELAFAGITAVGGVTPPDAIITSIMAVVLAKTTGINPAGAVAMAYPFGLLMQQINTLQSTLFVGFNKKADQYAKEANLKAIMRLCYIGIGITFLVFASVTFLSTYIAQDTMRTLVDKMPEWLSHGFEVAGGLLPAVGFAMLLKVMLKGKYVPYLLAGFIFASFIIFDNILPVAIIGLVFALIDFNRGETVPAKGGDANGEGI